MQKVTNKLQKLIESGDWPAVSRNRGVDVFKERFDLNQLRGFIHDRIQKNGTVRILEIGFGVGKLIWDFRILFPEAELFALNKTRDRYIKSNEDLKMTALYYNYFTEDELESIKLPEIYFQDCQALPFESNYFDVVISLTTLEYAKRKEKALQEIWRVLNIGGKAYVEIDSIESCFKDCPDFLKSDSPRFIIYDNHNQIVPLTTFLKNPGITEFNIGTSLKRGKLDLIMCKNISNDLNLNLEFIEDKSKNLTIMSHQHNDSFKWLWGYQSIYKIRENTTC
ncbi:MAG: methyltransferase domain-containing protein [Bacteroidetes bacterium]|nr:methyltransferase domain-containing protein [Bacteroidota bacterium]